MNSRNDYYVYIHIIILLNNNKYMYHLICLILIRFIPNLITYDVFECFYLSLFFFSFNFSQVSIIFQSGLRLRNSTHFKHHCQCQSRNNYQKECWRNGYVSSSVYNVSSSIFKKIKTSFVVQANFFSIKKSWGRFNKTESFLRWFYQ